MMLHISRGSPVDSRTFGFDSRKTALGPSILLAWLFFELLSQDALAFAIPHSKGKEAL